MDKELQEAVDKELKALGVFVPLLLALDARTRKRMMEYLISREGSHTKEEGGLKILENDRMNRLIRNNLHEYYIEAFGGNS